jgi:hypothetical protein
MGLTDAYEAFGTVLQTRQQDIAALQLVGRREAFFTNEFAIHLWKHSERKQFVYTNIGPKGERKYDSAGKPLVSAGKFVSTMDLATRTCSTVSVWDGFARAPI